ncbi:unnamed protein product [Dibothriocephalus latus]|uniref:Alpha-macroglobulin receptor-binding domain-containing protein n=1 Tax=Dibothriocephalus latus TaxID=60516 RepID=A0A3P6V444_DIBLA|nr:unnamed protein product [Dibothriocephalus latus]
MQVDGTGLITLQMDVDYNVEFPDIQKEPRNPEDFNEYLRSFDIECTPEFWGRNASFMRMTVCGKWVGNHAPEPLNESGMAVFEVGVPTGYVSLNNELRDYVRSRAVPSLRYARFRPGTVHFFFDKVTVIGILLANCCFDRQPPRHIAGWRDSLTLGVTSNCGGEIGWWLYQPYMQTHF